jgi:hypothetical protein
MKRSQRGTRPAFTLVELLVVMAIIMVLIALLLPAIQRVREASFRIECGNNLKQIGIALSNYHDNQHTFPSGFITQMPAGVSVTSPGWGWPYLILPYIEQGNIFSMINPTLPIEDPSNGPAIVLIIKTYVCPSDRLTGVFTVRDFSGMPVVPAATNSYAGVFGTNEIEDLGVDTGDGMFFRNSQLRYKDVTDGTAYTLAIGERGSLLTQVPWAGAINLGACWISPKAPTASTHTEDPADMPLAQTALTLNDPNASADHFVSPHPDSGIWLYVDGSVRPMMKGIDLSTFHALTTRAGGEPNPMDEP